MSIFLGIVTNLRIVKTTDDSVSLAWDPPANEALAASGGYMIEKLGEGDSFFMVHQPGEQIKKPESIVKPLEFNSRWQFRVKCISEVGPGEPCDPTDWVTVQMDKLPPSIELWDGATDGLNVKVRNQVVSHIISTNLFLLELNLTAIISRQFMSI